MKYRNIVDWPMKTMIFPWMALIGSPLLLVWYRELLMSNHLKSKKQYMVTGNWANYLSEVFSDPRILTLTAITVLLFGTSLFVTIRAIRCEKQKAYFLLGLLGVTSIVFVIILYCIFFTH